MNSIAKVAGLLLAGLIISACGRSSNGDDHAGHAAHGDGDHTIAAEYTPTIKSDVVDNFVLLDHLGDAHELYYRYDAPAIVIMIQGNGCPIVRNAWSDFKGVRDEYESQGVSFFMLNANRHDDRADIAAEAEAFGFDLPILNDETQLIAESLDVTRTAEVLVIDPKTWTIAYRGPVNNRLGYERQRQEASEHYLKDALGALMGGQAIDVPARAAKGCIVNLKGARDKAAHAQISYSETIAPILIENCVSCHQEGGIGPWAMTDYDIVDGFAPTIREVVRTRRMPPWSADPAIGSFHGARGLTPKEQQDLIHWIEAGSPRGEGPDPLAALHTSAPEWPLGEPDLIIEAPAFDVPATGVIDYQFPTALNPLAEDQWIRAVTVLPGDRTVVHHALVGSSETITPEGEGAYDDVFENYLIGYVPGAESYVYPENTGVLVKGGGEFRFQMHYTSSGKPARDVTKLGLYFHDERPAHVLRQQVALNPEIQIPPRAARHEEKAYFEFDHPAEIYMLFPHAHYRGIASKFELEYPDGRVEPILSVPRYDFNWQHSYILEESIKVPAGTRLIHATKYDNTERNFANPDPDRTVPWGLQSYDEMLYGSFFFRWSEETETNPVHNPFAFQIRQYFGFADANIDGVLSRDEAAGGFKRAWEAGQFDWADKDGDDAFSFPEMLAIQQARLQQRQNAAQGGSK